MRIKVDENIGGSGVAILAQAGHDVMTVREQGLAGSPDERVFEVCSAEGRTLVTLDRDFGHTQRFPETERRHCHFGARWAGLLGTAPRPLGRFSLVGGNSASR